ncbi:tyrosine-protein kinase transmembrane receptor Ror2-like [Oratosquilla oratoria]|uniref:tyrosine-protein kinase transmembrane receptor Ror2-like n=1 Tax=Oratosquilla oratoria TaxID=337810 RepID=UPI003F762484
MRRKTPLRPSPGAGCTTSITNTTTTTTTSPTTSSNTTYCLKNNNYQALHRSPDKEFPGEMTWRISSGDVTGHFITTTTTRQHNNNTDTNTARSARSHSTSSTCKGHSLAAEGPAWCAGGRPRTAEGRKWSMWRRGPPGGLLLGLSLLVVVLGVAVAVRAESGFLESMEEIPEPTEPPEGFEKKPELYEMPQNMTVVQGDSVTLRCRAHVGGSPSSVMRIIWHNKIEHRAYRVRTDEQKRVSIEPDGLRIRNVEKDDEGWYRCTAKTQTAASHSGWAYLAVLAETKIKEYPGGYSINYGTKLLTSCIAVGDPIPKIEWLKNDEAIAMYEWKNEVLDGIEFLPFKRYIRSVLTINATETANYTCRAENVVKNTPSVDEQTFTVSVIHLVEHEMMRPPKGYCAPYNGRVCRQHLSGPGLVWFDISNTDGGGWLNEQITRELWKEMIEKFREPCKSAAEKLLCSYAFPSCLLEEGYPKGLPLCQEDCTAVQLLFCVNEWLMVKENKQKKNFLKARGHFRLPNCTDLPRFGNGSQSVCTNVGLTTLQQDKVTYKCIKGRGRWYLGTANTTKEGIPCQRWDSQTPHSHHRPPDVFPEVQDAENFCRNAGAEEPKPWCYTMDPRIRWQHCDIPECAETLESPLAGGTNTMDEFLSPQFLLIVAGSGVIAILLLALIALLGHKILKARSGYNQTNTQQEMDIDLGKLPDNSAYHQTGAHLNPKLEKLQYDRNNIIYIRDLGQGAFGRVFQGKAPNLVPGEELTMVAVKVLKEEASDDMLADFEREACTLAEFEHPNIVRLLGVCAIGKPMCLLFEYMGRGDLNEFLRSCSPTNYIVRSSNGDSFSDTKLSHSDMIWVSTQVCAGMVYLADRKFVHRDLATRNCLIGEDMTVKIADFGLSQKIYLADYYRGDDSDAIPIRWMPLESILYNKYTVESDVWAFGVCMWEILSFALQPYYGMTHEEVVRFLKEGGVLGVPEHCPQDLYSLMLWCWQRRPHDRPSFRALHAALSDLRAGKKIHVPSLPPPTSTLTNSQGGTPVPTSNHGTPHIAHLPQQQQQPCQCSTRAPSLASSKGSLGLSAESRTSNHTMQC